MVKKSFIVRVTRDASVTFKATVLVDSVEELEDRCYRDGFAERNLGEIDWEQERVTTFDNVEAYRISHLEISEDEQGDKEAIEITDKEWNI